MLGCLVWSRRRYRLYGYGGYCVGNGLFKANPSSLLSTCYEKTTRVWTVHSPCTTCPSTSALLLYDCYAVAGREIRLECCVSLSVVGLLITIVNFAFCQRWLNSTVQNQTSSLSTTVTCCCHYWCCGTDRYRHLAAAQSGIARMALGVVAFGIVVIFGKEPSR